MALGWTVIVLAATERGGMAEAALYNAAMLGGVVLSAPACGWLVRRLGGRALLTLSGTVELVLRVAVLAALLAGAAPWLIAITIMVMNVAGWVSFAGMRAEVTAADSSPRSLTRYAVCIVGVEAAGTALAVVLPTDDGQMIGWLLAAVWILYPGSLLPTLYAARRSRIVCPRLVDRSSGLRPASRTRAVVRLPSIRLMMAGGGIMAVAAGPALLAVPITEQVHGGGWVAGAAAAFGLGTLLSDRAVTAIARLRLPAVWRWPLWGLGMLAGWIVAPTVALMVLVAQFAAGLSQAAFEGDMDAKTAADAEQGSVTRDLAYAAAARALGGAISVRLLPVLVLAPAVGLFAGAAAVFLLAAGLLMWLVSASKRVRSGQFT
ncbi:hypothetical protein [Actinoplanes sp. NPDC026619]|uniref:hypothetical protein n=1 Tax=Actinoplanes sp. NPDC026619 TaxID=3155798 RepID=UPI0033DC5CE9